MEVLFIRHRLGPTVLTNKELIGEIYVALLCGSFEPPFTDFMDADIDGLYIEILKNVIGPKLIKIGLWIILETFASFYGYRITRHEPK